MVPHFSDIFKMRSCVPYLSLKLMPYPPTRFLEALHSKLMSNSFPQYLGKSIEDRVRVRLGLGLTLAQWVRVRANPSSMG